MTTDASEQPIAAPSLAQEVVQPAQPGYYAPPSPQGPPQQAYAQPYGAAQPSPPRGLSIASMVCGISGVVLSFVFIGFLPALAAVILGHIGLKKEPAGKAFSVTGLATGYAGIAISLVWGLVMLAAILIPLLLVGSIAATEGSFSS